MRRLTLLFHICAHLILQTHGDGALEGTHTASSLEELVVQRAQSGMSGSDARKFSKLVKKLTVPMRHEIKKRKDRSQALIEKGVKEVSECIDDFETQLDLSKKATLQFREQSKKHKACRIKQAELISLTKRCVILAREEKEEVKILKGNMKAIKRANKHRLNEGYCKKMAGEVHIDWLKRMRGNMKQMVAKLNAQKNNLKKAKVKERKKNGKKGCKVSLKKAKAKKKLCDKTAEKMDAFSCSAAVTVVRTCDKLDMCYPVALKAYKSLESTTRLQVTDYKVDWRAFDRIDCYLGALGKGKAGSSNATHLKYCSKYVIDTSHLDVKFPALPKPPACPKAAAYPCTEAYVKAEYDPLPKKARGKCSNCLAMEEKKEK